LNWAFQLRSWDFALGILLDLFLLSAAFGWLVDHIRCEVGVCGGIFSVVERDCGHRVVHSLVLLLVVRWCWLGRNRRLPVVLEDHGGATVQRAVVVLRTR